MKYASILETVHETPLVGLPGLTARLKREIYVKLESSNPGGSMKDRIALFGIEQAERRGDLRPGATIVESTSGSLGTSLAIVGPQKGYDVVCVVDPKTSTANRRLMALLGARVVCVDSPDANGNYLMRPRKVKELLASLGNAWFNHTLAATTRAHMCHMDRKFSATWRAISSGSCPVGIRALPAAVALLQDDAARLQDHGGRCRRIRRPERAARSAASDRDRFEPSIGSH